MKKLFTSLIILLFTLCTNAQTRQWFTAAYGYGTYQAYIQVPEGYNSAPEWNLVIFLHGNGERGNDPNILLSTGLPKYINDGNNVPALVICPQMDESSWETGTKVLAAYNYMVNNYNVNINKVYITGLSLGATGAVSYAQLNASKIAAVLPVSGAYASTSPRVDSIAKVPIWLHHGTHDTPQNASNSFNLLTGIEQFNLAILPQASFYWNEGHSGTVWNDKVYSIFNKWHRWLNLHDKRVDSTAKNYVDSVEISHDWNDYWRSLRLVNTLGSSSHKTALLSRLAAVRNTIYGTGAKRVICDMGNNLSTGNVNKIANNVNGTVYTALIDETGTNSGWDLTVVTKTAPSGAGTAKWGENRSYFAGAPDSTYGDAFRVAGAAGQLKFSNLDNNKQYNIYLSGGTNSISYSYTNGLNVTINGVTKTIPNQLRNTHHHIAFTNISPVSGSITLNTSPYNNGTNLVGDGSLAFIELAEVGTGSVNLLPVANAGPDQVISTDSTTLDGSGSSDADGTITGYSWSQLSGPSTATITTTASSQPSITALTAGVYIFGLMVTDNNGGVSAHADTVQITVNAPDTTRTIKVNIYGGVDPYLSGNWNNWNVTANTNSGILQYDDNTPSPVSIVLSHSEKVSDNGASYGGVMAPPGVLRHASYSTIHRTLTISGLDNDKLYDIELYGSRLTVGNSTRYMIGTDTIIILTDNNLTNAALFTGVAPTSNQIIVRFQKLNTFNYINGLVITERPASFARKAAGPGTELARSSESQHLKLGSNAPLDAKIMPNPIVGGQLRIKFETGSQADVQLFIANTGGQIVSVQKFAIPPGKTERSADVSQLKNGVYLVRVQVGDKPLYLKFVKAD